MKRRANVYSDLEVAFVKARAHWPRRDLYAEFCRVFRRDDVTFNALKAMAKRNGAMTGRTGRFEKGLVPHNLGKPMPYNERSASTRFKPGSLQGKAAQNYKPIGTERMSKEGYLERKVSDEGLPRQRWRGVHIINWEAENGPVPKGMALKCLDGNRTNTAAENWTLISRALLPRLCGRSGRNFDAALPELKPTILAIARLEQAAQDARKADHG